MSLMWIVYLSGVVSSLGFVSGLATVISGLGSLITGLISTLSYSDRNKDPTYEIVSPIFKVCVWIFIVSLSIKVFVPTQDTMYMMAGAYAAETVVVSDSGQEILNEVKDTILYQLQQLQGSTDSK